MEQCEWVVKLEQVWQTMHTDIWQKWLSVIFLSNLPSSSAGKAVKRKLVRFNFGPSHLTLLLLLDFTWAVELTLVSHLPIV